MSEILRKIEEEAKAMIGKDVYAKVSAIDEKVTSEISDMRSDIEDVQEIVDELVESTDEQKKQTKQEIMQLEQAISSTKDELKKEAKEYSAVVLRNFTAQEERINEVESKVDAIKIPEQIDIKAINKQIDSKADKKHTHKIKDVEWLKEKFDELKEEIKSIPAWKGETSIWGWLKGIRGLVAWTGITIDDSNAKFPVINATWWAWAVDSVNWQTWVVVLDADDIDDTSTTNKFVTSWDLTKLSNITVTQAVDLDQMEADIDALANGMVYKGNWDASAWTFPWSWTAQTWWFYTVSVWGTVDWVVFNVDDRLVATIDNASATVYAWNWTKLDATDAVTSVNGDVGNVTVQSLQVVVSSSQTAVIDEVYVVVATSTFTDPSPVEWKWFKVIVRNGTATVWWTWYSVAWSEILRIFHSWAWANYLKTPSSWVNTWDQTSIVWISWTKAQFDTACSDGNFLYTGDIVWWDTTNNIWYLNIPQNSQSSAYTTVLWDSGKHLYHPSSDTTARTWTIDSNANVAYPVGTAITFVNDTSAWTITIAITSDTLVLAWAWTTGSRTLTANWVATAIKVTSTRWIISWTNLT